MKIFIPEKWKNFEEELSEFGRVAVVKKGKIEGSEIIFNGEKVSMVVDAGFRELMETLADLGYDFVALEDFDIKIPKVSSVEEVRKLKNFESLKSLIRKVKETDGAERCGAIGIFVGFVRKTSDKKETVRLEYEEDEELFEKKIEHIEKKLKSNPGIVDVRIFHRTGVLLPGEDIVYVVVMGEHRKDVWKPLEESMNLVKKELPVWKKEVYLDGEIWAHDADYIK
ncbi:MAG TPA: molybdenum cofactor biosynthesis protein MoaE [Archaeoglobaceae archaeon]|nr:molybdenum cofactor biosynthesis protein MoaE [Archaeoglobaceae archaeon]